MLKESKSSQPSLTGREIVDLAIEILVITLGTDVAEAYITVVGKNVGYPISTFGIQSKQIIQGKQIINIQ